MPRIYPVIMCGGAGTRLWPLSRRKMPKQFHALVTEKSMLQETMARAKFATGLDVAPPSFVCGLSHEQTIRDQCEREGLSPLSIILEPCARNTAPVAAVVALEIAKHDPDGLILLLPADHHIADPQAFWRAVKDGCSPALAGALTTLGIKPNRPETGYGYIQAGAPLSPNCVEVKAFVEKPDKVTATRYLEAGSYFWNGGIFLYSSSAMLAAFSDHASDILSDVTKAYTQAKRENGAVYLDALAFSKCRGESIDYAIMENAESIAMVCPVDMGWTDIGSWEALRDFVHNDDQNSPKETGLNTDQSGSSGSARSSGSVGCVHVIDCEQSYIRSDGPFVAAIGLSNMIVIAVDGAVLIADADRSQDVKNIVAHLKSEDRQDLL